MQEFLPQAVLYQGCDHAAHRRHVMLAGAKGIIAEEEARLVRLRQEIEGEAREELQRARESLEAEGRNSASGKLCATPFGIDVVGISQASLKAHGAMARVIGAMAGVINHGVALSQMQRLRVCASEDSSLCAGCLLDRRSCRR